ncbi:MAG: hypothetical protein UZ07_CHB004000764 [Chlorobi bacterium OLB7]|nr:MAG: hypothetical protein UZ07_CHB004000764 [Chlorobi bacterium OLB7]
MMPQMKTFHKLLLAMALTGLLITACNRFPLGGCIEGNGEVTSQSRTLEPFHSIVVEGSMDVRLAQGGEQQLKLQAEENLLPIITTTVENGVLTISSTESYCTTKGVTVFATMPEVRSVAIEGSGDVTAEGTIVAGSGAGASTGAGANPATGKLTFSIDGSGSINAPVQAGELRVSIGGSGDVFLKGSSKAFTAEINGSGDIAAGELLTEQCHVAINGSGDASVQATHELHVEINGSGDVAYAGNPPVLRTNINGSGDVVKR